MIGDNSLSNHACLTPNKTKKHACVCQNQSNNKVWKLLHIPSDFRSIHFFNWPLWRISLFPYISKATNGRASHRPFPPHLEVRKEACDVPSFRSLLCIWPSQRWTFCWIKSGQSINPSIKMNQRESKYVKMNQGEIKVNQGESIMTTMTHSEIISQNWIIIFYLHPSSTIITIWPAWI